MPTWQMDWQVDVGVAEPRRLIRPPQVGNHHPHPSSFLDSSSSWPLSSVAATGLTDVQVYCLMASMLVEKKSTQGTYQAQMIVCGSQVVHDCALILPLLSAPVAEGVTTLPHPCRASWE